MTDQIKFLRAHISSNLTAYHYEGHGYHLMIADDGTDIAVCVNPYDPVFGVPLDYADGTFYMHPKRTSVSDAGKIIAGILNAERFCEEFARRKDELMPPG